MSSADFYEMQSAERPASAASGASPTERSCSP
jgi:hypothetical protein